MPNVIGKEDLPSSIEELEENVNTNYREYVMLKRSIDDLTVRQNEVKKKLSAFVDENGLEDDKGHKWFDMDEVGGYIGMQRQRRVTQKIDEEACYDVLKEKGLTQRCYELKPVMNQEEVMQCLYEGLITEDELDTMFPKAVTTAFVLIKK